jgi:hypothetical protein
MAAVGPYRWLAERSAEMIPVRDAELRSSTLNLGRSHGEKLPFGTLVS